jgi:glycosyltransferase involved in cell wall biosynthesis
LYELEQEKKLTFGVIRVGAWLSRYVTSIVYNAEVSARQHETLGYASSRTCVIPNGFDCARFVPSDEARLALRRELGLSDDAKLIGLIARYHPIKDHATFLRAAAFACAEHDAHFVLAGRDVDEGNRELMEAVGRLRLEGRVHLLGARGDMPALTAALDVATSSSIGEGFPNVIGEAMACAVPCVVTDVGDSAHIVGPFGRVVKSGDAAALARAWGDLLDMPDDERLALGRGARERVLEHYSLDAIVRQYEALYTRVTKDNTAAG